MPSRLSLYFPGTGEYVEVDPEQAIVAGVCGTNLTIVDAGLKGVDEAFTDGRYGYFVSLSNRSPCQRCD